MSDVPGSTSDQRENTLVSCIVPARNAASFLPEALESVAAQTYRPLEIVVVDDGSVDDTAAIAQRSGARVVTQVAAGPAAARNLGIQMTQGSFVAFQDADDLWHPEKLARQMDRFAQQPGLDFCLSYLESFWAPHLQEEADHFRDHARTQPVPGYTSTTLVARRSAFDKIGLFNPALRFTDIIEWFVRARDQGLVMEVVPDVLTRRRIHGRNMSRVEADAGRVEVVHLVRSLLRRRRAGNTAPPLTDLFGTLLGSNPS